MEKKNIIIIVIVLVALIGTLFAIFLLNNNDAIKFKKEYESLNNTKREGPDQTYHEVSIPKNNPMKYVSVKQATDIIKNKTGIIYFGGNWCPWCRNAIPVLIKSAKENELDKVYYVDMTTVRNVWEVKDGKLIKTQKEETGYYDLLKSLDSVLGKETFKVKDENGKEYDTKEKRIYLPFVVAVKDGKIADSHVGTVELDENQTAYDKLTKNQEKQLTKVYNKLIDSINNATCNLDEKCS